MAPWKRSLYAAWLAQFLSIVGFAFVLPFLPYYIEELGVSDPAEVRKWSGIAVAGAPLLMAIFAPIWGAVADRYGRKLMVLRAMVAGAVVLWLMGLVQTPLQLTICRMLQGMLTGTMTASLVLVAAVAPRERAGYALGTIQAAVFVGVSLGPLVGGWTADMLGYRASFIIAGFLLLMGAVVVQWAIRYEGERPTAAQRKASGGYLNIVTAAGFLAGTVVLFGVRFANASSAPVFPLLVRAIRGSALNIGTLTGGILAVSGVAAAVSSTAIGRVGDRLGHKRLLVLLCLFAAAMAEVHALVESVGQLFVARMMFSFAAAGMMASANAIVRRSADDNSLGKVYGLMAGLSTLGMVAGPLSAGYISATLGLRATFLVTAGLLVCLAAVAVRVVKPDSPLAATDVITAGAAEEAAD